MADRRVAVGPASSSSHQADALGTRAPEAEAGLEGETPYQLVSKAGGLGGGGAASWLWLVGEGERERESTDAGEGTRPARSPQGVNMHPREELGVRTEPPSEITKGSTALSGG